MKWIKTLTAVVAILSVNGAAQAGLFNFKLGGHCGAAKSCGCAPTCQPEICKPTIARPCGVSVHTYQRACSTIKPPCCAPACGPQACAPKACAPAPKACAVPAPAPKVCAPAPKACAVPAPAPKVCAVPAPKVCGPAPKACGPQPGCGPQPCGKMACCDADPCEIATLIYESQTCCYARQRARALRKLGKNSCICNPEIMAAFVYGLNDADEKVRAQAASEICSQLRKHGPCCCSPQVVAALTCALGDCDKRVRRISEKALCLCGYDVVDGACQVACGAQGCGPAGALPPAPTGDDDEAAPAPAPPTEEPKAYFPSRLNQQQTSQPAKKPNRLANLFGLLN